MRPPLRQPPYLHGVGAAISRTAELLRSTGLRECSLPFYAHQLLEGDSRAQTRLELDPAVRAEIEVGFRCDTTVFNKLTVTGT